MFEDNTTEAVAENDISLACDENLLQSTRKQKRKLRSKSILELSEMDAKDFFLEGESYCNFSLPPYITFDNLLLDMRVLLQDKTLSDCCFSSPQNSENINYIILNNKDGKYAWRTFQLIHPVLYVLLVKEITSTNHWTVIKERFKVFSENSKIECISIPRKSLTLETHQAEQVSHWWKKVEQRSMELSLDYEYIVHTDITDCYPSIYTHSIAWALHSREDAKKNKRNKNFIGNIIDKLIQSMSHGQTNGIPQGSVLMDFIAEIVLGYADLLLSEKIKNTLIVDYHIIRYRDDYRIFTNGLKEGEEILKLLTQVMIELGMKLNSSKTKLTNQVIKSAIKEDKLYWIAQDVRHLPKQRHLMLIHDLSVKFPNSGSLVKALEYFAKKIKSFFLSKEKVLPLIAITADIAFNNPKTYPVAAKIISRLITLFKSKEKKLVIVDKIKNRFYQIPHSGHSQIWLQRVTIPFEKNHQYDEPICKVVVGEVYELWNNEWLKPDIKKFILPSRIIDTKIRDNLPETIQDSETSLFIWDS